MLIVMFPANEFVELIRNKVLVYNNKNLFAIFSKLRSVSEVPKHIFAFSTHISTHGVSLENKELNNQMSRAGIQWFPGH